MEKTAFIFPGQGSQFVGMGRALYDSFSIAKNIFDSADEILGFSLTDIMFGLGGNEEEEAAKLKKTEFTQPALFTHSAAATAVLRESNVYPQMTAGHSLGEYSALFAAESLEFEDGLQIVRKRGQLMGAAGIERPGTMAAILGLDDSVVEDVCNQASSTEFVVVAANYNSVGQIVISGDVQAVEKAVELATEAGARRALILPVSGAFHSPLMNHAREGLGSALEQLSISEASCPVFLNVTAQPSSDPAEIRLRLGEQLISPVRWSQSLVAMKENGASRFVEVGTGKVLSALVKRTVGREMVTAQAGTDADMMQLIQTPTTTNV